MTPLEQKSKNFATKVHLGQKRKYTGEDYIIHPAQVVELVRSVEHTEAMLCAAWLHDVVEDCGVTLITLEFLFGDEVATLVSMLTDISKPADGDRAIRKAIDLEHTAAASPAAKTVKLADLISNTESITKHDPAFAKIYLAEKRKLLGVLVEGNSVLWNIADRQCWEIIK